MARWDAAKVLPEPARTKYRRLAGIAQDRQAASRRASELVEEAREAATKARISFTLGQKSPLTTIEGIARLQAPIDEHEREIERLIADRDERGARSQSITALVGRIESYVGDLPTPTKIAVFSDPLPPRKKGEAAGDVVARCRREIEKLRDRITEISTAPRPLDECVARGVAEIEALAQRGTPDVDGLIESGMGIAWATLPLELLARTSDGMPVLAHGSSIDVMGTLAWMFRAQLIDAVSSAIRDANGDDAGDALPTAARPKMLASVRASLLELERVEEAAIEEAEAAGAAIERRPDADPRAVLTLSSELPPPPDDL